MSRSDDAENILLDAIYDAALNRSSFEQLGGVLAEAMGFRYGLVTLRRGRVPVDISHNQSDEIISAYAERYYAIDPWTPTLMRAPTGKVIVADDFLPTETLERSEFVQDFARPLGVVDPVGVRLPVTVHLELHLGFNQGLRRGAPTQPVLDRIARAGRHLQRAMQMRERIEGVGLDNLSQHDMMERIGFGMAICDESGKVTFLNAAGEATVRAHRGLRVAGGRLQTVLVSERSSFEQMVQSACEGGSGGALALRAADGTIAVLLLICPMQSTQGRASNRALICFRDPAQSPALDRAHLMTMFGMTASEADVALALVGGATLEEIAIRRNVRPSTLKSQLESVFRKVGVESQRDLVRLLANAPQVRFGDR